MPYIEGIARIHTHAQTHRGVRQFFVVVAFFASLKGFCAHFLFATNAAESAEQHRGRIHCLISCSSKCTRVFPYLMAGQPGGRTNGRTTHLQWRQVKAAAAHPLFLHNQALLESHMRVCSASSVLCMRGSDRQASRVRARCEWQQK